MSIDFVTLALAKQYARQVAGAGASEEQLAKLVEEYLTKNPVTVTWPDENDALDLVIELELVRPVGPDNDTAFVDQHGSILVL